VESRELIEELRGELNQLKSGGNEHVSIDKLIHYLTDSEKYLSYSCEERRRHLDEMISDLARDTAWGAEMFKAVLESGKTALNSIILINGGAVISLMGVMSSLAAKIENKDLALSLAFPMALFGAGVFSGGLAFAFRYISQAFYAGELSSGGRVQRRLGNIFLGISVLVGAIGYASFASGMWFSYEAFINAFKP